MISESEIKRLIEEVDEGPTLDYKEDLVLETEGDKAQFVKDVISLANSGQTAHLIIGVEDGTRKPMGINTSHKAEQLNKILKDKCDPPIRIEYEENDILHYTIGIVEITAENPPYIVSVTDKYGGKLSANPQKEFHIERGTIFIRNYNMNEGAKRADLDLMYSKVDLRLSHEIKDRKVMDDAVEINVRFTLRNIGHMPATFVRVTIQFNNIQQIVKQTGAWHDISHVRNNVPAIQLDEDVVHLEEVLHMDGAVLRVNKDVKQIEAAVNLFAASMLRKHFQYIIPLEEG